MNDGQTEFSETKSSSQAYSRGAQDEPEWSQSRVYTADDWERQRSRIHHLYIEKDLPVNKVIAHMERNYGFKATSRMYKSRFEDWGLSKNVKHKHWQVAAVLWDDREKTGKHTVAFRIHGKRKTLRELKRHIKNRGVSEEEFVATARAEGATASTSIRCVTPDPDPVVTEFSSSGSLVRPATSSGYSFVGHNPASIYTPSSSKSKSSRTSRPRQRPIELSEIVEEPPATATPDWALDMPDLTQDLSSADNTDFASASTHSIQQPVYCDHVQQDIGLMLIQTFTPDAMAAYPTVSDIGSWHLVSQPDDSAEQRMCPKCHTPSRSHSPLPPNWLWDLSSELPQRLAYQTLDPRVEMPPGSDEASVFQACCYAACMFGGQGRYELLAESLHRANKILEKMIIGNNSMTLLSVLLTLTILHAHDQGSMAASIIRSAHLTARRLLGDGNSVSLTIEWLTAAAGKKLSECPINTITLRKVYAYHQKKFGPNHQHSIVSLYCLAFNLILDKEFADAESHFTQLSDICQHVLGPKHLQTVSSLNGLSRAQFRQGKNDQAIETLKISLDSHPLGINHPFRLESKRRLALIYKKVGKYDLAEQILWEVLQGRIKTLGKSHSYTENARAQLEKLLKDMGKWDEGGAMAQEVQKLFDDERATVASDFESF